MKKITCSLLVVAALSMTANSFAFDSVQSMTRVSNETLYAANNYDSILDDFERYVDDYLVLVKKYKAGDMSAMVNAASMLESANSLSKKLESAQGNFTQAQMSRYLTIVKKLASATLQMM